jgi:7-dehydrocholesterol reductase
MKSEEILKSPEAGQWGRALYAKLGTLLSCMLLFNFAPWVVLYFYVAAFSYEGSLSAPIIDIVSGSATFADLYSKLPKFSWEASFILAFWFGLQVVLALVPDYLHQLFKRYRGGKQLGAMTPAGNRLPYQINGLQAWVISHLFFFLAVFGLHLFPATIVFDNWGGLLLIANVIGFCVALFVYIKAYLFPSFPQDRKWSGSALYDFFMGIELNPRIGTLDLKLFFNGRPGIVAWTLINISFAAAQYEHYGYITNSMILVNLFHGLYVLYFFWNESWYLNTIDIHHDHFGWMLAWGDCVWLPAMYTLQGLFLVFHPIQIPFWYSLLILILGLVGFWIFVSANMQKDRFRKSEGTISIGGKPATFISCQYQTKDGETRYNKLLTSGWWGKARHMNYTGDLILSLAYSLPCGFDYFFPYFYFFFILILLVHRCIRDEQRCSRKYGIGWERYCEKVPYRLIPGVF